MSCQRGNTSRIRCQKHQNKSVFKNSLHDSSKRTKMINNLEIAEVCKRCQEVIAWKIKYKKYKPLTQPKTCARCHQKTIKDAYHILCIACAKDLDVCCKCGKKEEIVAHKSPTEMERLQTMAQLDMEVKCLSERRRRAYYRYINKLQGKNKKKKKLDQPADVSGKGEVNEESGEEEGENDEPTHISLEEYFHNARQKLEELKKGMLDDNDIFEDIEDLSIDSGEDDD
ncbi:uncharacterized protein C9orf85 homolog [Procambarus clarkii]|uniref:uncharacterized protein C9orf85 homolog n=1 Tax=Procambarus clarkii TaxID=6728 RepID=UPI001E677CA1|nr:uncharacterized protein C9orf85 homolog isoform X3 [Procambarus clarkii]XP_045597638.1 uncharacterized protein C9orf85 homolog isoform X3 [Procambarus clarkii]XP_045597639.1 uncharacterized protein C9orf85 homolog isoform X3 [Procambarus clarkii]